MKKGIFALALSFLSAVTVYAEENVDSAVSEEIKTIELKSELILPAVGIVLLCVIVISAVNYFAYRKMNIRKILSQRGMYQRTNRPRTYNRNTYNHFNAHEEFNRQMQQQMNDEFNRQSMEHAMNESWKSVTPFDHGGYVQGPGFNPSDTAAQQMNDMNNMNMGMF